MRLENIQKELDKNLKKLSKLQQEVAHIQRLRCDPNFKTLTRDILTLKIAKKVWEIQILEAILEVDWANLSFGTDMVSAYYIHLLGIDQDSTFFLFKDGVVTLLFGNDDLTMPLGCGSPKAYTMPKTVWETLQ